MTLGDIVRENPRLKPVAPDVVTGFEPYVQARPNARVLWFEEYARAVVDGSAHRAGIAAITSDSVVLSWKHGPLYRRRSFTEVRRDDVVSWEVHERGLSVATATGGIEVEFRPGSAEARSFTERLSLIRPFGRSR